MSHNWLFLLDYTFKSYWFIQIHWNMKPPGAPKVSPVTQVLVARVAAILDIFFLVINLLTVRDNSDLSDLRDGQNIPVIS